VVIGLPLLEDLEVVLQGFFARPAGRVDAGQLLVLAIAPPIGASQREKFEMLQVARARDVRPAAEVGEIALLIEGDRGFEFLDVLHLVVVVFKDVQGFLHRDFAALKGDVVLAEFLHLSFDGGKIRFGDDFIAEIDIVIEAFFDRRSKAE